MTSGIYSITAASTGDRYIGSSINIEQRWKQHESRLRHHHHHNASLQEVWDRLGASAFILEVLEEGLEWGRLQEREAHYINTLHPTLNRVEVLVGETVAFNVIVPPEILGRVHAAAKKHGISIAAYARRALEEHIERIEKQQEG